MRSPISACKMNLCVSIKNLFPIEAEKEVDMRKQIMFLLKMSLLGLTVYFIVQQINMKFSDIVNYLLYAKSLFYYALALFIVFLGAQALIWVGLLNEEERRLSRYRGLTIYMNSQFAKYLPGGVWNLVGRMVLTSKHGVVLGTQVAAILYEGMMLTIVSLIYAVILLYDIDSLFLPVVIPAAVCLLLIYMFYNPLRIWIQKLLGRIRIVKRFDGMKLTLTRNRFFLYLGYYLASHLLQGFAFWLLLKSFGIQSVSISAAAGVFALSWLIGLISPLPGGIGIREGALVFLLTLWVPVAQAMEFSIITRVWNLIGEMSLFIILNGIDLIRKRMTA